MMRKIINEINNLVRVFIKNRQKYCDISNKAHIDKFSIFDGRNKIGSRTTVLKSEVGFASYISASCSFSKTRIGKYCSIASNVKIVAGNHPTTKYVSTHPLFYTNKTISGLSIYNTNTFDEFRYTDDSKQFLCEIGNDVWIGESVKILNGVCIGDGAIIATGAVVSKNVPPYAIVGGIPARIMRYRFDAADIDYLLNLRWWDKSLDWIRKNANNFSDLEKLKKNEESNEFCI